MAQLGGDAERQLDAAVLRAAGRGRVRRDGVAYAAAPRDTAEKAFGLIALQTGKYTVTAKLIYANGLDVNNPVNIISCSLYGGGLLLDHSEGTVALAAERITIPLAGAMTTGGYVDVVCHTAFDNASLIKNVTIVATKVGSLVQAS